jgi:hypothetical protein
MTPSLEREIDLPDVCKLGQATMLSAPAAIEQTASKLG